MKNLFLILLLSTFASWSQENSVKVKLDENSSLEMHRELFNPKQHKIEYKDNFVISIDNVPVYGSDGGIPKYELSKAILKIGDKIYNLQIDNMYNPWFGGVNKEFFQNFPRRRKLPHFKSTVFRRRWELCRTMVD